VTAFEFDCFGAAFFHQSQSVSDCVVVTGVERSIRHIRDQQSALHGASHGLQMDQNLVERDGHRVAVSQHDIAETVADENHVNSGFVDDPGGRVIVRCQTNETFAALFT
jgi:hypothetical protein